MTPDNSIFSKNHGSPPETPIIKEPSPWRGYAVTIVLQSMATALALYCAQYITLPSMLSYSFAIVVSVLMFRSAHLKLIKYLLHRGSAVHSSATQLHFKTENSNYEANTLKEDYISFSQMVALASTTMLTMLAASWALSSVLQDTLAYSIFTLMVAVCLFGPQYHKFFKQLYYAVTKGDALFPSDMLEATRQFPAEQVQAEAQIEPLSKLPDEIIAIAENPGIPTTSPALTVKVQWDYNEIQAKVQAAKARALNK